MLSHIQTWDIVLLGLCSVLFLYNFLLGRKSNIKIILSFYISIFVTEGAFESLEILMEWKNISFSLSQNFLSAFIRISIFMACNILFLVREPFTFELKRHNRLSVRMILHILFSFFGTFLFVSTLFLFFQGESFMNGFLGNADPTILNKTIVGKGLIQFYQAWFTFPAFLILITSFFFPPQKKNSI